MLVERAKEHSVVMTEEQIERLPNVCRVIVRTDREIEALCCAPVVAYSRFKELRTIRRDQVRAAAKTFMPLSVKDGPFGAV